MKKKLYGKYYLEQEKPWWEKKLMSINNEIKQMSSEFL